MSYILKNITMTLDPASIDNALKEVERFRTQLQPAMQCLIEYLAEKGVEVARAALLFIGGGEPGSAPAYDTGALSKSIKYKMEEGVGILTAGEGLVDGYGKGSYAIYVEYGTGIYGADLNHHGEAGWAYPAPWGWWIPKTGKHAGERMAWTNGMPPRPFMANTLVNLEEEAKAMGAQIIAEYIRGERA